MEFVANDRYIGPSVGNWLTVLFEEVDLSGVSRRLVERNNGDLKKGFGIKWKIEMENTVSLRLGQRRRGMFQEVKNLNYRRLLN